MNLINQMLKLVSRRNGLQAFQLFSRRRGNPMTSWMLLLIGGIGASLAVLLRRNGNMTKPLRSAINNIQRPNNRRTNMFNQLLSTEFAEEIFQKNKKNETNQEGSK